MRPTNSVSRFCPCLLAVFVAFALALAIGPAAPRTASSAPDPGSDDPTLDVDAWHRHAEAERKAAAAARRELAFARAVVDPNQLLYDVEFLDLDLAFDVTTESVAGTVGIRARVVTGPLGEIVLDLDAALTASACEAGGVPVPFTQAGDHLRITLDREYATDETVEVSVTYAGTPDPSAGAFGVETVSTGRLIWSLSEPFGARTWWPCKDTPSDKADSASIRFTVPSDMIAVSNGTLEQVVDLGATRRFEWFERYPITTYLLSIAAYPYVEQTLPWTASSGTTMPVTVWSYPGSATNALAAASLTRDMLTVFEDRFGPYPFVQEKYGQAQFQWGGGMEHQTATSLCCWTLPGLIAHELAHQWYGDQVTCDSFTEIWVNEGFATYAEALWREATEGPAGYVEEMLDARYLGGGTIRVPEADLDDFSRVFDGGLSYDKASWVLHMLRGVLGDVDFFAFLRAYASDPQLSYATATTEDVRRVAEDVSGRDLSAFFDQWIDQPWYPTIQLDWQARAAGAGYATDVMVEQIQPHWLYQIPVTVRVHTANGSIDRTVDLTQATTPITVETTEPPLSVEFDPDHWLLHAFEAEVPAPSFDRGLLVVNGVHWGAYGNEITSAYADSAFTGRQPFEFWDLFPTPGSGYVAELPAPRGHGALPPEVLGEYSAVVWVGNDYLGDLNPWLDAAVLSYLRKGGNLLLLTRLGSHFLTQMRLIELGATFSGDTPTTVGGALPALPELGPLDPIAAQSLVSPLSTQTLGTSVTLFHDASQPTRSLGHWRPSDGTATVRPLGGHFAYVAGRPYRWNHAQLRANVETILATYFGEPLGAVGTSTPLAERARFRGATPNPFNPRVQIDFVLPRNEVVRIEVHDVRGRRVRTLLDERRPKGEFSVSWNGTDDEGHPVASGVYTVLLRGDRARDRLKVTLIR